MLSTPVVAGGPTLATQYNNLRTDLINGGNILIQTIVGSSTPDEFNFTGIPATYSKLRLVGSLKQSFTGGGYPASNPILRINGDAGANYADLNPYTGLWSGWGSATCPNIGPIIGSWTIDAGMVNTVNFEFPDYAAAVLKWILTRNISANTGGNPAGGLEEVVGLWRSTVAINRIQLLGTYTNLSHLSLFGCAI